MTEEVLRGLLDNGMLSEVLWQLHDRFSLARKPLNFISENLLRFNKEELFPSVFSN